MNKPLTLGSLFDGSGAFPLAGLLAGIKPVWASEIEPFAIRVTTKRLPFVKHLGDIGSINGGEIPLVDIITFGSPCQDMSVAGKRAGLEGSRSSLFHEAIRIIEEMRCATNGKYPRYAVWENVPGSFSSNGGEDFRCVLEAFCKIKDESVSVPRPKKWANAGEILADGFSLAWRTFDAQYWGTLTAPSLSVSLMLDISPTLWGSLPQRRKRIYLVTNFDGECAGKVLFESEGDSPLCGEMSRSDRGDGSVRLSGYSAEGDSPQCGEMSRSDKGDGSVRLRTWQAASRSLADCIGTTSGAGMMFENHGQDSRYVGPLAISQTVSATYGTGGNNQPFVVESAEFCTEHSAKAQGIGYESEISPTLRAGTIPATLKIRCGHGSGGRDPLVQENKSATLSCTNDQTLFAPKAYGICSKMSNSMLSDNPSSGFYEANTSRTIDTSNQSPCKNQGGIVVLEGNGSRPSHHGDGYKESETMYTLNCVENHSVSYGRPAEMASACATLRCGVYGIGRPAMNQGYNAKFSFQIEEEKSPTLVASGAGGVAHPAEVYSTNKNSHHTIAEKDLANTLVASDYKDPPLVNDSASEIEYIVRRLTPRECALLQGMPTWWCDGLESENPTDAEIAKWTEIFAEYVQAVGKTVKPKTRNQIIKWLKNPYSDSAAYKMWGNGIYAGNGYFVLAGIAWAANEESALVNPTQL